MRLTFLVRGLRFIKWVGSGDALFLVSKSFTANTEHMDNLIKSYSDSELELVRKNSLNSRYLDDIAVINYGQ